MSSLAYVVLGTADRELLRAWALMAPSTVSDQTGTGGFGVLSLTGIFGEREMGGGEGEIGINELHFADRGVL